jgi:hypothetical protein
MKCVTCDRPFPERTEKHPGYFAQYSTKPGEDVLEDFAQETDDILEYLGAVLAVMIVAKEVDEEVVLRLVWLSRELCDEAQRRLEKTRLAGVHWQERAEAYQKKEG